MVDTSHTRTCAPDIKPLRRRQRRRNPVKPLPGSWKDVSRHEDVLPPRRKLPKQTLIEMYAGKQTVKRHEWVDTYKMRKRVIKKLLKWDELVLKLLTGEA